MVSDTATQKKINKKLGLLVAEYPAANDSVRPPLMTLSLSNRYAGIVMSAYALAAEASAANKQ